MIIKIGILVSLILGALVFLGVKMGESIKQREIKMFFFILYAASIFTVFNIVVSVYFFINLRDKTGPPGSKGKKGETGDKGDFVACDKTNCYKKTLEQLIINKLTELNGKNDLSIEQKLVVCSYVNQLSKLPNFKEAMDYSLYRENLSLKKNNTTSEPVKIINFVTGDTLDIKIKNGFKLLQEINKYYTDSTDKTPKPINFTDTDSDIVTFKSYLIENLNHVFSNFKYLNSAVTPEPVPFTDANKITNLDFKTCT